MNPGIYSLCGLFILLLNIQQIKCSDKEMTILINPGKEDCFYVVAKVGQVLDIEYQVIDGSHGDLDISFTLSEPSGRILFADFKASDKVHRADVKSEGEYKFCFDNKFSSYNSKTVFFSVIVESDEDDDDGFNDFDLEGLTPEEFYDMKIQDIQDVLARVRVHLNKVNHIQEFFKNSEARDRNVAEENYFRVNLWSMFQIIVMLTVGLFQVVIVMSYFDNESKVNKVFHKINEKIASR